MNLAPRTPRLALWLALPLLLACAGSSRAQGRWETYLHMSSCRDLLVLRDTVWIATGEAGLLHYRRSTGTWGSITREPNGLAGNDVGPIVFDRSGDLFAGVPGKGVSRLDTDGRWSLLNAFDGLPSDTVLTLRAQGDSVWIGTTRGLALWNGSQVAGSVPDLGTPSPFTNNNINGVVVLGDTLVVSTPNEIYIARLSRRLTDWTPITTNFPLLNINVRGIASDGSLLLALVSGDNPSGGLILTSFRWNRPAGTWSTDFPAGTNGSQVRRLRDDNAVLLATGLGGTYIRGSAGWTAIPGAPATDNTDALQLDVSAIIVPGPTPAEPETLMSGSSLGRLLERALPQWTAILPPGPVGNNCRAVAWADGVLYASYNGEGGSRLRDGVWRNYRAGQTCTGSACDTTFVSAAFPATILADPLGPMWVTNWEGPMSVVDDSGPTPRFTHLFYSSSNADSAHLHYTIHAVAADSTQGAEAGRWFGLDSDRIGDDIGNPQGLDLYDASGRFIRNFDTTYPNLRNGLIRGLACDRSNVMWVGYKGTSAAGVSTFPVPGNLGAPITLSDVPETSLMDVFGMAAYGDTVWALASDGLKRFDQSARSFVTSLSIAGPPALASMHPLAVTPDGSVYVGTTGGLRVHRRGVAAVDYTPDNSPLANIEVRGVFAEPSGAVWVATAGGVNRFEIDYVAPPEPPLPSLSVRLYPNPAQLTGAGIALRLVGQARAYAGEVHDLTGRIVHRFSVAGNGAVIWDGRDLQSRQVRSGVYFVRVRGGGAETTSRVVILR